MLVDVRFLAVGSLPVHRLLMWSVFCRWHLTYSKCRLFFTPVEYWSGRQPPPSLSLVSRGPLLALFSRQAESPEPPQKVSIAADGRVEPFLAEGGKTSFHNFPSVAHVDCLACLIPLVFLPKAGTTVYVQCLGSLDGWKILVCCCLPMGRTYDSASWTWQKARKNTVYASDSGCSTSIDPATYLCPFPA